MKLVSKVPLPLLKHSAPRWLEGGPLAPGAGGGGGAAALARALMKNTALTRLSASHFCERGFNSFASCLPSASGLKELKLGFPGGLARAAADAPLKGPERGAELEDMPMIGMHNPDAKATCEEMKPKIKRELALSQAGKRVPEPGAGPRAGLAAAPRPRKVLQQAGRAVLLSPRKARRSCKQSSPCPCAARARARAA